MGGNNGSQNVQNAVNTGYNNSMGSLNPLQKQLQGQYNTASGNYNTGLSGNQADYSSIMDNYRQFLSGGTGGTGGGNSFQTNPALTGGAPPNMQLQGGTPAGGGGGGGGGDYQSMALPQNPYDQQAISQFIEAAGAAQGRSPGDLASTASKDVPYWTQQIMQNGGMTQYWKDKLMAGNQQGGTYGNGSAMSGWGALASGQTPGMMGYQNFANTGGFSPQDIATMQARGEAPARAIYQNAQNDLATSAARTGGYAPNQAAAQADLARGSTQAVSANDIATNANIAQMKQQGELAGLSGLQGGNIAGLQGMTGAQLGGMSGMTGAYGSAPGMSSMLGNQMLGTGGQQLSGQALMDQISQMLISGQLGQSQVPSNFQQGLGNAGGIMNLLSGGSSGLGGKSGGSGGSGGGSGTTDGTYDPNANYGQTGGTVGPPVQPPVQDPGSGSGDSNDPNNPPPYDAGSYRGGQVNPQQLAMMRAMGMM